jgi:nucleoside-diphosphate-sugar epimerase
VKATVLLTGATGYLGCRLLPRLLESGYRVFILKRPGSRMDKLGPPNAALHIFDIETDGVSAPFNQPEKIDTVIHLATCYGKSGESATEILKSNFDFPVNLLETAIKYGTDNFINADTFFNVLPQGACCLDNYSLSKGLFHAWAVQRARECGLRFMNMRLEHLYGPGDSPQKFVNWLVKTLLTSPSELELTSGEQERDFVHIDDVITAFTTVLTCIPDLPRGPQEMGVGRGESTSIRHFAELARTLCASKTHLAFGARPLRDHEIMTSRADPVALARLGWQAKIGLKKGLQQVIDSERRHLNSLEENQCSS